MFCFRNAKPFRGTVLILLQNTEPGLPSEVSLPNGVTVDRPLENSLKLIRSNARRRSHREQSNIWPVIECDQKSVFTCSETIY